MTDHLTDLRDRHLAEAEMFSAAPSRAKFHQNTADALTALIEAREDLHSIALFSGMMSAEYIVGGGEGGHAKTERKAHEIIARIDALGKEKQDE